MEAKAMRTTGGDSLEMHEILDGQRVVIVGRAPYLHTAPECERQGEFIDSHDIVVRVGWANTAYDVERGTAFHEGRKEEKAASFTPFHNIPVLGAKASLYYKNMTFPAEYSDRFLRSLFRAFLRAGGRLAINAFPNFNNFSTLGEPPSGVRNALIRSVVPFRQVSHALYGNLTAELGGAVPCAGTIATAEILTYSVKSVRLIGFTCYAEEGQPPKRRGVHSPLADFKWLKARALSDKRLDPGPVLGRMLAA